MNDDVVPKALSLRFLDAARLPLDDLGPEGYRIRALRVNGRAANAAESPFGFQPRYEDLHWDGVAFPKDKFHRITDIDRAEGLAEAEDQVDLFKDFGSRLPAELEQLGYGAQWIPGGIGGALRMNAGAHGGETKDTLIEARGVDRDVDPLLGPPSRGDRVRCSAIDFRKRVVSIEARPSTVLLSRTRRG